jgi:hypothetical protein
VSMDLDGTADDAVGPGVPVVEGCYNLLRHLRNLRALSRVEPTC